MSFLSAAAPLRFLSWPLIRLPWSTTPKRAARPNAPLHSGFQKLPSEPGTTAKRKKERRATGTGPVREAGAPCSCRRSR